MREIFLLRRLRTKSQKQVKTVDFCYINATINAWKHSLYTEGMQFNQIAAYCRGVIFEYRFGQMPVGLQLEKRVSAKQVSFLC